MKPLKTVALLCSLVLTSACVPSKYSVVASPAEEHQQLALNNEPLVAIKKDGSFIWRKAPEDVVKMLVAFSGEVSKLNASCQAELAKYAPAKPKPAAKPVPQLKK